MGRGTALDQFSAIFGTRRGVGYQGWFREDTAKSEAPFGATQAAAERRMFFLKWWLEVFAPPGAQGDGQPIFWAGLADAYNLFLAQEAPESVSPVKRIYSRKTCKRDL